MSFESTNRDWEQLAQKDALWAILTHPEKSGNKWNRDDFFGSGVMEISILFEYLNEHHLLPSDCSLALDFGCGVGRLSRALSAHFEQTVGVDVSATMLEKARYLNNDLKDRLSFMLNESEVLPFSDHHFSLIYSSIVLQHIPGPQQRIYLAELCRVLKPGGTLIFQIPTADIRKLTWFQKLRSKLKIREKLTRLGLDNYHHMQMNVVPLEEVVNILQQQNCQMAAHELTNHTDPDFGGKLRFLSKGQCKDYESSMFVVQKKEVFESHDSQSPG